MDFDRNAGGSKPGDRDSVEKRPSADMKRESSAVIGMRESDVSGGDGGNSKFDKRSRSLGMTEKMFPFFRESHLKGMMDKEQHAEHKGGIDEVMAL